MPEYKVLPAGDTALVVEFGETIDRRLSTLVLALARRLSEADLAGIVETVPTFRSLMVHYDPLVLPAASLIARIGELMKACGWSRTPAAKNSGAVGGCRSATTRGSHPTSMRSRRGLAFRRRRSSSGTAR